MDDGRTTGGTATTGATTTGGSERVLGGRYRLERVVGHGGMGVVWAAHDELLGRAVAVKQLGPPGGIPEEYREELRERALRESRAAARIASPHAVVVHDVLEEADRLWLVMQLLPSRTLADAVKEGGPMPPAAVARIGLDLVEALIAIHAVGIVHRDVKPANVLLLDDGHAVLADFGIASTQGDSRLTISGQVMGSPGYIAPERVRGGEAVGASDLWSLGALLWTALEGGPPFADPDPFENLAAAMTSAPPSPSHGGPLVTVVDRLLDPDPDRRATGEEARELLLAASVRLYADAAPHGVVEPDAVAPAPVLPLRDTGPAVAGWPVTDDPSPWPASLLPLVEVPAASTAARRRPVTFAVGALLGVALLAVVAVVALVMALRPGPARSASQAAPGRPTTAGAGSAAPAPTPSASAAATRPATRSPSASAPATPAAAPSVSRTAGQTATPGATPPASPTAPPARAFVAPLLPGWTRTVTAGVTTYRMPGVPGVLEVSRPRPGVAPLALLTQQETRAARLAGYRRISLGPASVAGRPGAAWEYTWKAGGPRHGLVRAVDVPAGTLAVRWYSARAGNPAARAAFDQLTTLVVGRAG